MKKADFIQQFVLGRGKGKLTNLRVSDDGNTLINYYTPIAHISGFGSVILNTDKYSSTTSCNQNLVRKFTLEAGLRLEECPEEALREYTD